MIKIMVVDDEAVITTQLEERLSHMGYHVVGSANSGEEAVEKARQLLPDIILMDIVMPGKLSGIAASEIIKKELDIPVIFLTAYASDVYVTKAKNTEPFGYLIKPFQEKQVKAAIEISFYKRQMEQKLKESERRYRSVVDTATDGIIIVDSKGVIQSLNAAACNIFGYEKVEMIGNNATMLFKPPTNEHFRQQLNLIVETGVSSLIGDRTEYIGIKKDGTAFQMEFALTSWETGQGLFFTIISRDITERVEIQQNLERILNEKELLLKEINSRVKSNMQIISNLLVLQSESIQDKTALTGLDETRNRIESMLLVHDLLYRSENISEINFETYLQTLIDKLFQNYSIDVSQIDIVLNIFEKFLGIHMAIPIGLIVNELIITTLRYAFPNGRQGRMLIDLKQEKVLYVLTVQDNGLELTAENSPKSQGSLGLKLVNTLCRQIDAVIKIERESGNTYTIFFKRR
ncbi:PAS domain S-box protein [candidate division KSB1 bacterium]|nr:PAS domain S-box protein [candidate division KSB1 bacterium]